MSKIKLRRPRSISDLVIGETEDRGEITIPYEARTAHLHVIGRTRQGKSRFIADLITQDMLNGQGLTLFDPHSELYDYIVRWVARRPALCEHTQINLVDFTDESTVFAFNPLKIDDDDEAYGVAETLTLGLSKVFGTAASTSTPQIKETLTTIFVLLAQQRLPVAAAEMFYDPAKHQDLKKTIVEGHPEEYYRTIAEPLINLKGREFRETVQSSIRRLRELLDVPSLRRMFSQTTNTFDFRAAVDQRSITLFNLRTRNPKKIGRQQMKAVGTILLNSMLNDALSREPAANPTPHLLYIDEVQNYVNDDIEDILTETSKFGLYLTLSHQTLSQLREAGDEIYYAVMACTLLKALFSVPHGDAMQFVDDLFGDRIHPERLKENILSPTVVGHERTEFQSRSRGGSHTESATNSHSTGGGVSRAHTFSESESDAWSDGESHTVSEAHSTGAASGAGATFNPEDGAEVMRVESEGLSDVHIVGESRTHGSSIGGSTTRGRAETQGVSTTYSNSKAVGSADTESWQEGTSEGVIPIIKPLALQTWTLEDQRYHFAQKISRNSPRHGLFAVVNQGTIPFKSRDMPDLPPRAEAEAKLLKASRVQSEVVRLIEEADPSPISMEAVELIDDEDEDPFTYAISRSDNDDQ